MILSAESPLPKSKIRAKFALVIERNQHANVNPALPVVNDGTCRYCEDEESNFRQLFKFPYPAALVDAPFTN